MKTVAEFMATSLLTAAPRETVTAVVRRLTDHGIGGLPVLEGGAIVGMVTLKDLVGQPPYRPVREVMIRDVLTVAPTERITDAYALMDSRRIGRLPVVDHGVLVGIVTRGDLLDRKSTRLNSSHVAISYAVFCLKKKTAYCSHTK